MKIVDNEKHKAALTKLRISPHKTHRKKLRQVSICKLLVKIVDNGKHKAALTKLRISPHKTHRKKLIQTNISNHYLKRHTSSLADQRMHSICEDEIEDEYNFMSKRGKKLR